MDASDSLPAKVARVLKIRHDYYTQACQISSFNLPCVIQSAGLTSKGI
jgi:hypothetical protein